MTARSALTVRRLIGATGLAWGVALLVRGPQIWQAVAGDRPEESDRVATRVLGARHLAQGGLQTLAPQHLQTWWVVVDALHASSMLAAAASDERRRRPALLSAAISAVFGLAAASLPASPAGRPS